MDSLRNFIEQADALEVSQRSLIFLCLLNVALLLLAEKWKITPLKVVSKTLASTCFLIIGAKTLVSPVEGLQTVDVRQLQEVQLDDVLQNEYGIPILAGLALGMVGDLCLLVRGKGLSFMAGLVSFLFGHVAYVYAFYSVGMDIVWFIYGGFLVAMQSWCIWLWLRKFMGRVSDMYYPVIAYVWVISLMVTTTFGMYGYSVVHHLPEWYQRELMVRGIAAELFYLSDICVARERFVNPNDFMNLLLGLPLYYIAQLTLAIHTTRPL